VVRGEIWWATLPTLRASEPGYKRPVLILQSDAFNRSNINTVICVIITSNIGLARAPGNVMLSKKDSNLPKKSVINVSQIVTLDKSYLTECAGTISKNIMHKVENGIKLALGI
jgi:mRNA interferase MazF